jgi:hypothetical protein
MIGGKLCAMQRGKGLIEIKYKLEMSLLLSQNASGI